MSITLTDDECRTLSTERLVRKLEAISKDTTLTVEMRGSATNALELLNFDQLHADQILYDLCYWNANTPKAARKHAQELTDARSCWKRMHSINSA